MERENLEAKKILRTIKNRVRNFIRSPKELMLGIKLLFIYIEYRATQNKIKFLYKLSFEELRRLSEFKDGLIKQEVSGFLQDNSDYNSKFQEWWFKHSNLEGMYDPSLKIYQKLLDLISDNSNIKTFIDLGCNSGEVVHRLSQIGIDAVGVDFPSVVSRIQWPIKTIALDLNEQFPTGTYDVIFCREILEHITNPDRFLKCCRQIAHPGTFLFISCPYTNRHYLNNAFHLRILSHDQLTMMVERHGFKLVETFIDRESNVVIAQNQGNK